MNEFCGIRMGVADNVRGKICSVNFEPPDNELCSARHIYQVSRGAWMISILSILNRFTCRFRGGSRFLGD